MADKTFLLGVGCQKGGTTWLHDYLGSCPSVCMGIRKEYHALDQHFIRESGGRIENARSHRGRIGFCTGRLLGSRSIMTRYIGRDIRNYFEHFEDILQSRNSVTLTADITPSYAVLPAEVLAMIRDGFAARGIKTKVIFIMRDPIERVLSATRMYRRNRRRDAGDAAVIETEQDEVLACFRSEKYEVRTRYQDTIANLEAVFPEEERHYEFFERLFRDESIEAIARFLDIPFVAPDLSRQINVSRNDSVLDATTRAAVFEHYRDTYAFVARRFGADLVRDLWANYREFGECIDHRVMPRP